MMQTYTNVIMYMLLSLDLFNYYSFYPESQFI